MTDLFDQQPTSDPDWVRLFGPDDEQIGVVAVADAYRLAEENDCDIDKSGYGWRLVRKATLQPMPDTASTSLPYAGTSGWSGTDTSAARAVEADQSGQTSARQRDVLRLLAARTSYGMTWQELSQLTSWHHGTASGVLSVLHKDGKIARLTERRVRCRVYVDLAYVADRPTDTQGRTKPLLRLSVAEAGALARIRTELKTIHAHDDRLMQWSFTVTDVMYLESIVHRATEGEHVD